MAVKCYQLIKLEEFGIFEQNKQTGQWYVNPDWLDTELTHVFSAAGMFEH